MPEQKNESDAKYEQFDLELDRFRNDIMLSKVYTPEKKRTVFGTLFMMYVKLDPVISQTRPELDQKMKTLLDDFGSVIVREEMSYGKCRSCHSQHAAVDDDED